MASFRNEKSFRVYNMLFTLGGVPLYNRPNSFIYTLCSFIVLFFAHSLTFSILVYLYINIGDLDKASDAILLLPVTLLSSWIRFYLSVRRDYVGQLLIFADNFNWDDLPPKDPITGKPSIALMIPRIKKASLGVLIAAFGFLFAQTAISVIISEERPLIFNTWYPYDISKSPAYEITMAFQTMGLIFGCGFVLYVFPPFYATLVVIACCQFEKLRAMLSDMKQQSTSSVFSTEDGDEEFKMQKELFIHMRRQLHNCIRLHQQVLRYKNELEETFSILFVGIFLLLLVALCFTTYSAALRWGNIVNVSQSVVGYSIFLTFIFLFCWFPSELTEQADKFRDAVWGCDWVGTPVSFQRSVSFLLACATKDVDLKAGKCVSISKETMLSMIQESFSLFMFLIQVRDKDEDEA